VRVDDVVHRVAAARPRVAAEMDRPHSDERLLAEVVVALPLPDLARAFGLPDDVERALLWGADVGTGAEDLGLAAALHAVLPGAGRAALLDAEPDLVVVTGSVVAAVDATVGRPGHAVARARRGEPVPGLDGVAATLGVDLDPRHAAPARLAAVALALGRALGREPCGIALGAPSGDLLHPERDDLAAWAEAAAALGELPVGLHVTTWLDVARRLGHHPAALAIRAHPVLSR
jgi:hypothetical protein